MTETCIKGPRPLSLHFSNSQIIWSAAGEGACAALQQGIWHSGVAQQIKILKQKLDAAGQQDFFDQLVRERAAGRKAAFLQGINEYLSLEFNRPPSEAIVCKQFGSLSLLDYGGDGQPILLIPSLVNPPYILDLMPGRSLVAFLKEKGFRPYLVNWGTPGAEEAMFGLDDYICRRLVPALDHVCMVGGGAVPVVGYCMGGTLSVALTARTQQKVSRLALLAAPWDFATEKPHAGRRFVPWMIKYISKLPEGGMVGVDMLQTFFASVDPTLNDRKFRSYAAGKYRGAQAEFFSAMEVWANNGQPLVRRVAEECMTVWYKNNETATERWIVAGEPIRPSYIDCPVLVAAPKGDRLVPQDSAFALLPALKKGYRHEPPSGHIGMVVGDRARAGLWEPLVQWLEAQA